MTGNEKLCKIYIKNYFQNVLAFIDLFYTYHYPRYFFFSYCMWRHVCTTCNSNLFIVYRKKIFYEEFFLQTIAFVRKNKGGVLNLNQIWILKTLTCILMKKIISYCMIFETNIFIEMVDCVAVDCESDTRQGRDEVFKNSQKNTIWNSNGS